MYLVGERGYVDQVHGHVNIGVSNTMTGDLPPSSSETDLRLLSATAFHDQPPDLRRPREAHLIGVHVRNDGGAGRGSEPGMTLSAPSGTPASSARRAQKSAESVFCSAGWTMYGGAPSGEGRGRP